MPIVFYTLKIPSVIIDFSFFDFPFVYFTLLNYPLTACDSSSLPKISPDFYCFLVLLLTKNFSRFYSFLVPIFTFLSSSSRLRFLFYSISTFSSSLQFFSCDSSSPPAISFYLLPFKTITMPEIPSTFLIFYSIYPRFNLSIRFIFHPFERSFALKNLENAKNSPEIMQFDNPNSRQNPMILCFTT